MDTSAASGDGSVAESLKSQKTRRGGRKAPKPKLEDSVAHTAPSDAASEDDKKTEKAASKAPKPTTKTSPRRVQVPAAFQERASSGKQPPLPPTPTLGKQSAPFHPPSGADVLTGSPQPGGPPMGCLGGTPGMGWAPLGGGATMGGQPSWPYTPFLYGEHEMGRTSTPAPSEASVRPYTGAFGPMAAAKAATEVETAKAELRSAQLLNATLEQSVADKDSMISTMNQLMTAKNRKISTLEADLDKSKATEKDALAEKERLVEEVKDLRAKVEGIPAAVRQAVTDAKEMWKVADTAKDSVIQSLTKTTSGMGTNVNNALRSMHPFQPPPKKE